MRRLSAALLLGSLAWTACSVAGPAATKAVAAEQVVSLQAGESAELTGAGLRVGFERVVSDSRCPKGVQCIRAGEAVVRLWLQRGAGPRQSVDMQLPPVQGVGGAVPDDVQLLRLEPAPVGERPIVASAYTLTLQLHSIAGTSTTR
jgi:hypothetical protein